MHVSDSRQIPDLVCISGLELNEMVFKGNFPESHAWGSATTTT